MIESWYEFPSRTEKNHICDEQFIAFSSKHGQPLEVPDFYLWKNKNELNLHKNAFKNLKNLLIIG